MNAVIYARYSSDSQRKNPLKVSSVSAGNMLNATIWPSLERISTGHYLQKQQIDRSSSA